VCPSGREQTHPSRPLQIIAQFAVEQIFFVMVDPLKRRWRKQDRTSLAHRLDQQLDQAQVVVRPPVQPVSLTPLKTGQMVVARPVSRPEHPDRLRHPHVSSPPEFGHGLLEQSDGNLHRASRRHF
jgi:hypothetical protein